MSEVPSPSHQKYTRRKGSALSSAQFSGIVSFIWGTADDVLRDIYVRGKYRDVILPMIVIRRLDAVLEPTKEAVLQMKKQLDEAGINAHFVEALENGRVIGAKE